MLGVHELIAFDRGDCPLRLTDRDKDRLVDVIRAVQPGFRLSHSQYDPCNTAHSYATQVALECRMIAQARGHKPGEKVLGAPQLYLFEECGKGAGLGVRPAACLAGAKFRCAGHRAAACGPDGMITARLADHIAGSGDRIPPSAVQEAAALPLFDTVAAMVSGSTLAARAAALAFVGQLAGPSDQASVVGLGLDAAASARAPGFATHLAGGNTCWMRDPAHVEKGLVFAGFPAQNGLRAALLARPHSPTWPPRPWEPGSR